VHSPKLDSTTLARDELAFITTHLSLKPGPTVDPSVPANARLPRSHVPFVAVGWYLCVS
jgi:hypothetical protein